MKYFLITIIFFFQFSSKAQEIIDLVGGNKNLLWTVANGNIQSWNIDNEIPELQTDSLQCPYNSLSIGYINISSDTILNTYINAERDTTGYSKIVYWDGEIWENLIDTQIEGIQGIGSFNNHLYLKSQWLSGSKIHYYNGIELKELELPFSVFGISDVAVDENGIAWYPSRKSINNQFKIDTIHCFNQDLSFIEKYPLSENICGLGAYGTALINDTLYIGFNHNNIDYPNKVISISIENGIAQITNKIINFGFSFSDFASSNSMRESVSAIEPVENTKFKISPNPVTNTATMERTNSKQSELYIFSITGKLVVQEQISGIISHIDLSKLPSGIYYLQIDGITKEIMKN